MVNAYSYIKEILWDKKADNGCFKGWATRV